MGTQNSFDFTVDEGKGWLNPSRDKNESKHGRRKVEKSCVIFLLRDRRLYAQQSDVRNKWDEHTHTHTHTSSIDPPWEDQREWHRMTRMTRPDCAVMCNLINTHTHTHKEL